METKTSTLKDVSIIVKWNGKEYPITDLSDQETVAVLKHEIARLTNVRPERQKLLNLKYKGTVLRTEENRKMVSKRSSFLSQANQPQMNCDCRRWS